MVLLVADLDRTATILGNENLVTGLNAHDDALAVSVETAGTDGEDLGFIEFLDGGFGEEDAAGGAGLGLHALDEHAVQQRDERFDGFECGGLLVEKEGESAG